MRKWTTRDGRRLDVMCMTCDHLRASVNRILRLGWRMEWLSVLLAEIERRCKPKANTDRKKELETQ